jgi:hypothetical protein
LNRSNFGAQCKQHNSGSIPIAVAGLGVVCTRLACAYCAAAASLHEMRVLNQQGKFIDPLFALLFGLDALNTFTLKL